MSVINFYYLSTEICSMHYALLKDINKLQMVPDREAYLESFLQAMHPDWEIAIIEARIQSDKDYIAKHRVVKNFPIDHFFLVKYPTTTFGNQGNFLKCVCYKHIKSYAIKVSEKLKTQLKTLGAEYVRFVLEQAVLNPLLSLDEKPKEPPESLQQPEK